MVLYCNRFIILFTQIIHKKQMQKIKKTFLILQYSTLKSTVVQCNGWHTWASIEWTGKKSYWLEEGEEVGDGRAEGSSAVGDGGQAAISLTPDVHYQLHHRCFYACFYACFWTSWAWNKDTVLLYSITVLYSKVHNSTTTCRGCTHMTMYADTWTNLPDWTCECVFASLKFCNLKVHM